MNVNNNEIKKNYQKDNPADTQNKQINKILTNDVRI